MTHPSNSKKIPFGAAKLCQDFATLVNNRQGSDIQFKVGGGDGNSTLQESAAVTLYAHSLVLRCRSRYFATMLDEDKHWKESSDGIIYKPNVSPSTFQDVLHYIYTGSLRAKSSENIIELIIAADEMDLEELSIECQTELTRIAEYIFSDTDNGDDKNKSKEIFKGSENPRIPIDVAVRTHIIPTLNFASSHSLSHLTHKLQDIILPRMFVIIKSPDAYTTFINEISAEAIIKVITSDNLAMTERCVWDLALSWGCHQTKLSKNAVEARLNSAEDDENDEEETSDGTLVNFSQLNLLKETLAPLLPFVRFSLLDYEDYSHMVHTLSYFLPRRRYSDLVLLFFNHDFTALPDTPRKETERINSKIIIKSTACELLRKVIFETGGIIDCPSLEHLKFKLLFRASENGFYASTFHKYCDEKGPTLILVKSANGHLFGGVNFNDWKSNCSNSYSSSPLNFLFALPDRLHRRKSEIFRIRDKIQVQYSSCNHSSCGPVFGKGNDLRIANAANTNQESYSCMPSSYTGSEASSTALAGTSNFMISDYEVFAISKK